MMERSTFDVFISYAQADRAVAEGLSRRLQDAGLSVWIDREAIAVGQNFIIETLSAVRTSRIFAVVISEAASRSSWITSEIANALAANEAQGTPQIVPLCADSSIEDFPFLRQFQYADISTPEALDQTTQLLKSLLKEQNHGPLPPPQQLAMYNQILPGTAERIVELATREQLYRIERNQYKKLLGKLGPTLLTSIITAGVAIAFFVEREGTLSSVVLATAVSSVASIISSFARDWLVHRRKAKEAARE